ncbi:hypothetical protein K469DRAFT_560097, partial [Zopfia rhizophila CBS 207.26]
KVSVFDQHRVNSAIRSRSYYKSLLVKLKEETYDRYRSTWKRLLCYVYRLVHLRQEPRLHHVVTDQQSLMRNRLTEAMATLLEAEKGNSIGRVAELRTGIGRRSLDFCISMLDHRLRGNLYDSIVVGFFAVLGIDDESKGFREPVHYASHLSAFVKIAQLLVIQRAVVGVESGGRVSRRSSRRDATLLHDLLERFFHAVGIKASHV